MFVTSKQIRSRVSITGLTAAGLLTLALANGCSQSVPAREVETGGPNTIRTINHIDDQDWAKAATKLTDSMLDQPGLFSPNPDGSKRVLAISRIINNTSQVVDTDLLIKQIRVTLNQSGKVVTQTTDVAAGQASDVNNFLEDKDKQQPDYRLSGKLIETQAHAGDVRQSTFYFMLSLTGKNGDDAWENQIPITKIGTQNSVGL